MGGYYHHMDPCEGQSKKFLIPTDPRKNLHMVPEYQVWKSKKIKGEGQDWYQKHDDENCYIMYAGHVWYIQLFSLGNRVMYRSYHGRSSETPPATGWIRHYGDMGKSPGPTVI